MANDLTARALAIQATKNDMTIAEKQQLVNCERDRHIHSNKKALDKISEQNGELYFNNNPVGLDDLDKNFVPLSLGEQYEILQVREDWYEVPIYITDDEEVLIKLTSNELYAGEPKHSISLEEYKDNITGMPVLVLKIINNGASYACYSYNYTDSNSNSYSAGWYDNNGSIMTNIPTFSNMEFNNLQICNDTIDLITKLSDKAESGLDTISRMVNVSTDAMGTLGVVENGVQRLNHAPVSGRRYALITGDNMTFPLPTASWTGTEQAFTLDLECTTAITLTLPSTITYADGKEPDTGAGTHTLRFFRPATSTRWSVEEVKIYNPYDLPDQPVSFATIDERTLGTVLRAGHATANNEWAVTRDGVDQVWFRVGDTRQITLTDDSTVTMRIIGFEYDTLSTNEKAAMTCDIEEVLQTGSSTTYGAPTSYAASGFRSVVKDIVSLLPNDLLPLVVPVKKGSYGNGVTSDKVWAFSFEETWESNRYPVFTDNASRIRMDRDGNATLWGLRTYNTNSTWMAIVESGALRYQGRSENDVVDSVAVGFCLNA